MLAPRSLALRWLGGLSLALLGCSSSTPGASTSASASPSSAPAPAARRDLGSLADFKTRWNAAVAREGKVPALGELEQSPSGAPPNGAVDAFRAPPFDLGAPVTLAGTVDHATQALLRVTLTIATRTDDARQAMSRAVHPLLDAIDPSATSHQHDIAALSIPFSASSVGDFFGGYTIVLEPTPSGGAELSIAPTTPARLEEMRRNGGTPTR